MNFSTLNKYAKTYDVLRGQLTELRNLVSSSVLNTNVGISVCFSCGLPSFGQPCWNCRFYPISKAEYNQVNLYSKDDFIRRCEQRYKNPGEWFLISQYSNCAAMTTVPGFKRKFENALLSARVYSWPSWEAIYYSVLFINCWENAQVTNKSLAEIAHKNKRYQCLQELV